MSDFNESNFHSELVKRKKKLQRRQRMQVIGVYCFIIVLIGVVAFGVCKIVSVFYEIKQEFVFYLILLSIIR